MLELVQRAYLESLEYVSFVPTPMYGTNPQFTEMAVVANENIKPKRTIGGLTGFTATMEEEEITKERESSQCSRPHIVKEAAESCWVPLAS